MSNTVAVVKPLIEEIRAGLSQTSSSARDEERVMRAMLNDRTYKVGVYGKDGKVAEYCPSEEARKMIGSINQSTTKMGVTEAQNLANAHEFKKAEAEVFVGIAKEFVNTYVQTGRKLPLGGREKSDIDLSLKEVEATTRTYPKKVGVNADGTSRYVKAEAKVPAHQSVRVHSSCPDWVK